MLHGVFRTKEGKIIAAILGLVLIMSGIFVFINYSEDKQFSEQAVMAENYLKTGSYEQAVEAYLKAMSMKKSDQQLLSIGLADAYVGMNDYDKALEVLRTYYQKTSGNKIKEKIEEVTSNKTDYEYLQSISHADVYFSNKEYDKAIIEYEKAKQIKSKEVTSYKRIAEAYIEKGEYTLAREEVVEGKAITQSEGLDTTLEIIDSYLLKEQYDIMVSQAAEYIYQENYKDGVAKYEEAIALLPKESMGYLGLGEAYIAQEEYDKAVFLLEAAVKLVQSDELADLLNQAVQLKTAEDERENILSQLYDALEGRDFAQINAVMNLTFFKESIILDAPIYYGGGEGDISKGYGTIIYDSKKVYFGDIKDGMKKGTGIYFMLTRSSKEQDYYFYEGEWKNDIPNGRGKTEEVEVVQNFSGETHVSKTVTEGLFYNAAEDDSMMKYFYMDGEETGRVSYLAQNGVPQPLTNPNDPPIPTPEAERYIIGMLYLDDQPTGENLSVDPQTIWGVKPFMKSR